VLALVEQEAAGRLATVRLDKEGSVVDLLFASSGIEREIVTAAIDLEVIKGLRLPVATVGHLVAMKLLSSDRDRRPTDDADLAQLALVASVDDWRTASDACELIGNRGYPRGRDLLAALAALRART
jgi:hypothetical protein